MDFETFFAAAEPRPSGVYGVSPTQLKAWLPALDKRGYWVTRVEAFETRGGKMIVRIDFQVIGADGPENWENHNDIDRHTRLVRRKIEAAEESGLPIELRVWIEQKNQS